MHFKMEWARGPLRLWTEGLTNGAMQLSHVEEMYNPFDYYYPDHSDRSLYLRFASLDPSNLDEVKAFVSQYGILGLSVKLETAMGPEKTKNDTRYRDGFYFAGLDLYRDGSGELDFLDLFRNEHRIMNQVLTAWELMKFDNPDEDPEVVRQMLIDAMVELWVTVDRDTCLTDIGLDPTATWTFGEIWDKAQHYFASLALADARRGLGGAIEMSINGQLNGFTTFDLRYDTTQFVHTWGARSLLSAMYLMLSLDLTRSRPPQQCANEKCRKLFIPTRADRIYCSDNCKNQQRLRAWRKEQKDKEKAQKMHQDGVQPEDIASKLGIDLQSVLAWVADQ